MSGYVDRMQWVCNCGHARALHNNTFSRIEPGQPMPDRRPDTDCSANDCECVLFTPADFKYETFEKEGALGGLTRYAETATGIPVVFHISGTDLSVLKSSHDLKDFDDLAEDILAGLQLPEESESVTYQWYAGSGFQQV